MSPGLIRRCFCLEASTEVTLAAYPDDVPTGRIDAALDHLSDSWTAVRIGVTGIGIFGGLSPIVHLAVAPTTALLSYHNQLYKALADHPCDTRYRPGAWTPGIPVSAATVSVAESVRCLLPYLTEPVTATLVAVELVQRPSGTAISSRDLRGG
jgi:hypothetical protein